MITLTSDFGLRDPYVAEMKGVMLTTNPKAIIVDISHDVEKFNVRMGAFILASAAPFFPKDTIHLVVVDPGVGTQRRAILVQTKMAYFIGPDNGVLMLAALDQGVEHIYELLNHNLMLPKISNTFHGRDIFAPAGAKLDKGVKASDFGQEISNPVTPNFVAAKQIKEGIRGEVLHIDGFGNIITNIKEKNMINPKILKVKLPSTSLEVKFGKAYSEVQPEEPIVLVGSHEFVEIAVNHGSAAEKFHLQVGDKILLTSA